VACSTQPLPYARWKGLCSPRLPLRKVIFHHKDAASAALLGSTVRAEPF